jgi:hypothetical protein
MFLDIDPYKFELVSESSNYLEMPKKLDPKLVARQLLSYVFKYMKRKVKQKDDILDKNP